MLDTTLQLASFVLQQSGEAGAPAGPESFENAGKAVAVGLAALAAGYAERGIGSAAVGAVAEDSDNFVNGLILTVLPETIIILALVAALII
jgi:V/A-type H+-transporting ATPase subunit K